MHNRLSKLFESISYSMKWSPLSWVYPFSRTKLRIFNGYHRKILEDNLKYVYIINSILSVAFCIMESTSDYINNVFPSLYTLLPLSSIIYHIFLFVSLKAPCLKKRIMKAIGVLNFGSLLLLVAALEIHERTNYLISHSTANVEIAVLGCGVVTVYFQDSFIQSVFLWVCLIGMSCYVTLFTAHNLVGADFGELAVGTVLTLLPICIFYGIVHTLIQRQMRLAFLKLEKNVSTNLETKRENSKQEKLLLSIFPASVAHDIQKDLRMENSQIDSDFRQLYISRSENVSILFADIKGFTSLSAKVSAQTLVTTLNELFARFDSLAETNHCLRIKILGDCYYCVSGLFGVEPDHALHTVEMGLQVIDVIEHISEDYEYDLSMRVGIHTGSVLSGLIGLHKWQFDVWSNDVTIANAMEAGGVPGKVHVSEATKIALDGAFVLEKAHGRTRNKLLDQNNVETFFVVGYSAPPTASHAEDVEDDVFIFNDLTSAVYGCSSHRRCIKSSTTSSSTTEAQDIVPMLPKWRNRKKSQRVRHGKDKGSVVFDDASIFSNTIFVGDMEEKRNFGVQDIMNTLGINSHHDQINPTNSSSLRQSSLRTEYLKKLEEAIVEGTSKKAWKSSLHAITMKFKDLKLEAKFQKLQYETVYFFCVGLWCVMLLFYISQLLVLPRQHTAVHVCFMTSLTVMATTASISLANKITFLRSPQLLAFNKFITTHRYARYAMFIALWLLAFITVLSGVFECQSNAPFIHAFASFETQHPRCDFFQFQIIQLNILMIAVIMPMTDLPTSGLIAVSTYGLVTCLILVPYNFMDIILVSYEKVFKGEEQISLLLHIVTNNIFDGIVVIFICITGIVITRQYQITKRTNFLRMTQSVKERSDVEAIQENNRVLLSNILPSHVINHFLSPDVDLKELYYEPHAEVGVMFASIQGFTEFYEEQSVNQQGIECLRFLNEIIADFDQLLMEERFLSIEKIKTVGSTYMVASGVNQEGRMAKNWKHLEALVDFSFALRKKLAYINKQSFNSFDLRIGVNHGPVVAGVIGANKPQYDIWGDTVNLASRMESTGIEGCTQVVQETQALLLTRGYKFDFRGVVSVKGKGSLITYFARESRSKSFKGIPTMHL